MITKTKLNKSTKNQIKQISHKQRKQTENRRAEIRDTESKNMNSNVRVKEIQQRQGSSNERKIKGRVYQRNL